MSSLHMQLMSTQCCLRPRQCPMFVCRCHGKQASVIFKHRHVQGTLQGPAAAVLTFTSKQQIALEQGLLSMSSCKPGKAKQNSTRLLAFGTLAYVGSPVVVTQLASNTLATPDKHATDRWQPP